eukprot:Gb_26727 [translate_table: standard]
MGLMNKVFFIMFFSVVYFLIIIWREKMATSMPLHVVRQGEMVAIISQLASFIYLVGFFGIDYVQNAMVGIGNNEFDDAGRSKELKNRECIKVSPFIDKEREVIKGVALDENLNEDIVAIVCGSYPLDSFLGDCSSRESVRRRDLELMTNICVDGLPLEGFNYD